MVRSGIDLERIARFAIVEKRVGKAFYARVFTPLEQARFGYQQSLLSLCFTAKEAVAKTLGTGLELKSAVSVCCSDIEIVCGDDLNRPQVNLRGRARELARELNLNQVVLLWHHNRTLACSLAGAAESESEMVELQRALAASMSVLMARMDELDAASA